MIENIKVTHCMIRLQQIATFFCIAKRHICEEANRATQSLKEEII